MSSSNTQNQLSELQKDATSVVSSVATAVKGSGALAGIMKLVGWGTSLVKLSTNPVTAGLKGLVVTGRFLAFTTVGRAVVLVALLVGTFTYFKAHFTAVERHQWEIAVEKKQDIINGKVTAVEAATSHDQQLATVRMSTVDKILAVVVGGIWKTEPADPVEAETVDLINETRGKPGQP